MAGEEGVEAVAGEEALQRRARSSASVSASFASRLKRTISLSSPQKAGFSRLRRWAKSEVRLWPLYSVPLAGLWTEKLICVFCPAIPSSLSRPIKRG